MPNARASNDERIFLRHLIISNIPFQEDIDAILTGLKLYFRLGLSYASGVGDEKRNPSVLFDSDGNGYPVHRLSSGWKGRFLISTRMPILQFFWYSEISGEERSSYFFSQRFGWKTSFSQRPQRKTCTHCFLGYLVTILQRRAVSS